MGLVKSRMKDAKVRQNSDEGRKWDEWSESLASSCLFDNFGIV